MSNTPSILLNKAYEDVDTYRMLTSTTNTSTTLYENINAPYSFWSIWKLSIAVTVIALIGSTYYTVIIVLTLTRRQSQRPLHRRIAQIMFCQALAALIGSIVNMLSLLHGDSCKILSPLFFLIYSFSKASTAEIAFKRAMTNLNEYSARFQSILKLLRLSIVGSATFSAPVSYLLWEGRLAFSEQFCVSILEVPRWAVIGTACSEANLAMILMFIFVVPVYNHAKSFKHSASGVLMLRFAKRNLILAAVSSLSTLSLYVIYAIAINKISSSEDAQMWLLSANWVTPADMLINLVVSTLLFSKILKPRLRRATVPSSSIRNESLKPKPTIVST